MIRTILRIRRSLRRAWTDYRDGARTIAHLRHEIVGLKGAMAHVIEDRDFWGDLAERQSYVAADLRTKLEDMEKRWRKAEEDLELVRELAERTLEANKRLSAAHPEVVAA